MSTVGHVAVALGVARFAGARRGLLQGLPGGGPLWALALVAVTLLPDLDFVIPLTLGLDPSGPFAHRGATHSFAFAIFVGAFVGCMFKIARRPGRPAAILVTILIITHPLLDLLTTGPGIALFWPLSDIRLLSPWQPLPAAPIGASLFTPDGLERLLAEVATFLPLWVYAAWSRRVSVPEEPSCHC